LDQLNELAEIIVAAALIARKHGNQNIDISGLMFICHHLMVCRHTVQYFDFI